MYLQSQRREGKQKSNRPKRRASDDFCSSTSAKKIRLEEEITDSNTDFIFFMHFSILNYIINAVSGHAATCRAKKPNMSVEHLADKKMGFAQNLKICCLSCHWKIETFTSPEIEKYGTPGNKRFAVNSLAVIAFREIGKGHEAMKVFSSCIKYGKSSQ